MSVNPHFEVTLAVCSIPVKLRMRMHGRPRLIAEWVRRLYYKNATHQLTNVTETHEKGLRKRIRIMYEIA